MNINITSKECAWSHFEVKLLGRTIKGLRGFSLKKSIEKEHLYGAGSEPLDIMEGNKKYEGNIKILGFEYDALSSAAQVAGYDDITEVPHEAIVLNLSYKKRITDKIKSYTVTGVGFTEAALDMEQNAKHREITIPFLAMNISQNTL